MELYEEKKRVMQAVVDEINARYGVGTATVDIRHQYYNMRKEVEPHYHIVEKAVAAHTWRHGRSQPFIHGTPLPQHLCRGTELPWQDGVRTGRKHGKSIKSYIEYYSAVY